MANDVYCHDEDAKLKKYFRFFSFLIRKEIGTQVKINFALLIKYFILKESFIQKKTLRNKKKCC